MQKKIEVHSQDEFDICVKAGNIAVVVGCRVAAWGNSSVVARGNSSVVAWGNSSVVARENSSVVARENSSVEAWGNSSVEAGGNSSVAAWGNSSVVARENSSVVARENSSVAAWDNSSVVARGNSSVVAWGNVFVRLFSALSIKASAHVVVMLHGKAQTLVGGRRITANKPKTPQQWCDHYGVEVKKGVAVLYKALNAGFVSPHGVTYAPGTIPMATDWDSGKQECGGGLHFSPHPQMALSFNTSAKLFAACPVRLKDIVVHPDGTYPEKIKAKGCCAPVWQVDRHGKKIEEKQ